MKTYVISLDRTPQRLAQFRRDNHLFPEIEHFSAVDGQTLSLESSLAEGVITAHLSTYSQGALGCAYSHRQLWLQATKEQEVLTICEDDAILHHDFKQQAQDFIPFLPPDWDFILWGWNFDAVLLGIFYPPLSPITMQFDQEALRANKLNYLQQAIRTTPLKVVTAFGTPCYSISPKGASKFLQRCFPLSGTPFAIPGKNASIANFGIDVAMNFAYQHTQSFFCFPPLALTDNDHTISTVQVQPKK